MSLAQISLKRIVALAATAVLAVAVAVTGTDTPPAGASRLAGIAGVGVSAVQLINLDAGGDADVAADFFRQGGALPVTINLSDLAPLQPRGIFLPAEAGMPNGAYAVAASTNRRISTLTITNWPTTGAAVAHGDLEPSTAVIVPFVTRSYAGQTSIVNIQNTDPAAPATVTFEAMPSGSTTPALSTPFTIPAGTSISLVLDTDPAFDALPDGFLGWVRLTSAVPVAAVAFTDVAAQAKNVYAVAGIPESMAAAALAAPFVVNAVGGGTSAIAVLNPGTGPADVAITYHGAGGTCAGQTIAHDTATIGAGVVASFHQGDVPSAVTGRSHLPEGCAAAATITATAPVIALANVANTQQASSAAYPALRSEEAGRQVILPLYRRNFIGATEVHVVNPSGNVTATARLEYMNKAANETSFGGCGSACQVVLAPGAAHRWVFGDLGGIPDQSYGLARIVADQPVLATVFDNHAVSGNQTNDQAYNGVSADGGAAATRHVPLALRSNGNPITRTPGPGTATGTAPTPTSRPTGTPDPRGVASLNGMSGLAISNLSSAAAADITVDFVDQNDGGTVSISRTGVLPGSQVTIFLPAEATLPEDGVFAARVSSNVPVAAMARTDWQATGHAVMYNAPAPATRVVVPWLLHDYVGQTSIVSIQNTVADAGADVTIDIMENGGTQPIASVSFPLGAGAGTSFSLGTHPDLAGVLPAGVPAGLLWGRVSADRPVAVMTTIANPASTRSVYSLAGVPEGEAFTTAVTPMLFNNYAVDPDSDDAGRLTSGISVLNPGPDPVGVKLTYRGADVFGRTHACQGQTIEHTDASGNTTITVAAGAVVAFYQGNSTLSHLPANCAVSGTFEVTGGAIVAGATVMNNAFGTAASVPVMAAAQAAQRIHLPAVRGEQTAARLTTAIQVQNVGDAPASVQLDLVPERGGPIACGADCTATIPPHGSRLWWLNDVPAWPAGMVGEARVTGDRPVVAAVVDMSLGLAAPLIDMVAYHGVADNGRSERALPLLLNGGNVASVAPITGPTPTPAPVAPEVGLPTTMPTIVGGRVRVPVSFSAGSHAVAELTLALDYDASWLRFDDTDGDGDGVPDSVAVALPPAFRVEVDHRATAPDAEVTVRVTSLHGAPRALPEGSWLTITLDVTGQPGSGARGVSISPLKGVSMRGLDGRDIPATMRGGWSPNSRRVVYLPVAHQRQCPNVAQGIGC